ncbi:hypothetical protein QQF64_023139 [Cirrhinus molitorella]|uniref:ribonuclease H n=1 Tax=Cirrhinus molitorella TaxID=172907 RepID=A0ABR3L4I6_9TELE
MEKEIRYMLDNTIATPSSSEWASPCLLVGKSDGTVRFCTDFRKVNSVTKPDCFPLPRIDDCIDQVGSAKYVSKFDLLKGYWQVPLTQRAQEMSSFITPSGLYSYQCEFAKATVTYLGKVVGNGEVRPVQAKVQAVQDFPSPTTKRELMRFLGLAPSFEKPFTLLVDASNVGAGAVLQQSGVDGLDHPGIWWESLHSCLGTSGLIAPPMARSDGWLIECTCCCGYVHPLKETAGILNAVTFCAQAQ